MPNVMPVRVIFSDKPSEINIRLIKFFNLNLLNLLKTNLIFTFDVASVKEADEYKSKGIIEFPVLLRNSLRVSGSDKIMKYLGLHVKKHNTKIKNKSDDDHVQDFWKETLGNVKLDDSGNIIDQDDDDEETDLGQNLQHKIQEAFEQREHYGDSKTPATTTPSIRKVGGRKKSGDESPSETIERMAKSGKANRDDLLMAKFFENQEDSCS